MLDEKEGIESIQLMEDTRVVVMNEDTYLLTTEMKKDSRLTLK